jgi:hypothetical protein
MEERLKGGDRVLALVPSSRGLGYAVFEGPARLVDWGVGRIALVRIPDILKRVDALAAWYVPDVIALAEIGSHEQPRRKLASELNERIGVLGKKRKIRVATHSQSMVRQCFSQVFAATFKAEIAEAIVKEFPELSPRQPPKRVPWKSQDARMCIFDAAAVAITHFYAEEGASDER